MLEFSDSLYRRHRLRTQRLRPMPPFVSSMTILLHKPYKVPTFHIVAAPHVGMAYLPRNDFFHNVLFY